MATTGEQACVISAAEPIGTTSTEALACNSHTLDLLLNSSNLETTNRVGDQLSTYRGIITKLGIIFDDPIRNITPNLVVNDLRAHRYPANTGDIYIPIAPLPFTTGASGSEFDTDDWTVLQGVTSQDLINDLSQAYTFETVALMQASLIVFPVGKKIFWQGYYAESDGGSNWGLVASGAHTDDGGSVFTLADGQHVKANLKGGFSIKKFGARSDGITDIQPAATNAQAVLPSGGIITIPQGDYFVGTTINWSKGIKFRGEGIKGDYRYLSGGDTGGTKIIVKDGITAIANTTVNNTYPEITGMTFAAETSGTSAFGQPANYSVGTNAIDMHLTIDAQCKNLSFESLDRGIFNTLGAGQDTLRPVVKGILAQDCNFVIDFVDGVADAFVTDVPIFLHCNNMMSFDSVDGVTLGDLRLFQAYTRSLYFRGCQFVSGSNITCFETNGTQVEFDDCDNVEVVGLTASRAGWYGTVTPYPRHLALRINNSRNVDIQGSAERPSGKCADVIDSDNVNLNLNMNLPNNTNGGFSAIDVLTSEKVQIRGSLNGRGSNTRSTVNADDASRYEVSADVSSDVYYGNLRYIQNNNVVIDDFEVTAGVSIGAGGSATVATKIFKVPAGKYLVLSNIFYNSLDGLRPRIGAEFFNAVPTTDEGLEQNEDYLLSDNSAGAAVIDYSLELRLNNATVGAINTSVSSVKIAFKIVDSLLP